MASTPSPAARELRDVQVIQHPPTWRPEPLTLTYLYPDGEPDGQEMAALYRWAAETGYRNTRVVSPRTLQWSELFHPRFYDAARRPPALDVGAHLALRDPVTLVGRAPLTMFWLQSTVFLASVTLSAAIVQSRWSSGTLASKYDRLWQVGELAEAGVAPPAVRELALHDAVRTLAVEAAMPPTDRLLAIRSLFEQVIARISIETPAERAVLIPGRLSPELSDRFGFVASLRDCLGPDLLCVVAYGSSVTSRDFADIDLLIVSAHPDHTLRLLAGTSPHAAGKELNVGIYSPDEVWRMQLLSGDNLLDYGLCLYGEVEVPVKARNVLRARNLSFGVVRQRQQLGMIGAATCQDRALPQDERRNLYEYFVKIPANVVKGTWGVDGRQAPKNEIYAWLRARCGFDTVDQQRAVMSGDPGVPLAAAAVATGDAMAALDEELLILSTDPVPTPPQQGAGS